MTDPQEHPRRARIRARRALAVAAASSVIAVGALVSLAAPAAAAGPSITVTPSSGLSSGQNVTVKGSGFTANYANMVVVECAASATGANGCDTNDVKFTKADANGAFTVTLTIRSKFGTTDCTKVECIVQGHEGFSTTSGKTGTSAALHFATAAKPAPKPTHKTAIAPPPAASPATTAPVGSAATTSNAGVGAVHAAAPSDLPTGANTGKAVSTAAPLYTEVGGAAALVLLLGGLLFYRRRPGSHTGD